jgi:hypothetical protein
VLRLSTARIGIADIDAMSTDEYRQMFMAYTAALLADFDRYLQRGDVDLLRDGVAFGIEGLWLDDTEFAALMRDLYRVLQPLRANTPKAGRRRRLLASVLLPADEPGGTTSASTREK